MASRRALVPTALLLVTCGRGPSPSPSPDGAAPTVTATPTASAAVSAPPPPPLPSAAASAGADAGPRWSREGLSLDAGCADPQTVLGKASYEDRGLIERVRRAMRGRPELTVVAGKPAGANEVRLTEATYGSKRFSAESGPNSYAIIAECPSVEVCVDLAAMIRATVSGASPKMFCGEPPAISGQKEPLRGPWR